MKLTASPALHLIVCFSGILLFSACGQKPETVTNAANETTLRIADLRCEYLTDPLGIDTILPRFSWKLVDAAHTRGQKQTAWQIIVTLVPADNAQEPRILWDSGKIESSASVNNEYDGAPLQSNQVARWKVRAWDMHGNPTAWSDDATFTMGLLDPADWKGEWIRHPQADELNHIWYRKNFQLASPPAHAFAHVATIGYHELYVNGSRVCDRVLAPAVSNLKKRVLYVTYDIAPHLRAGDNVIALWTGSGWARADGSFGKGVWQQASLLKCQIDMSNGVRLHTDDSWKCQISHSKYRGLWKGGGQGEYGGEVIDARAKVADWNQADFDDSEWATASVSAKDVILSAHMIEPDRKVETLRPRSITEGDGYHTFDMGVNFTGWIEFKLRNGEEGQLVKFTTANREGETMEFDQISHYIHDASGTGTFSHRFNYNAGRWITVHGLGYTPELEDLTCYIVTSDFKRTGYFESSNPLFNTIYETDLRTFIANTVNGVTMDCPHRERYGYGEIVLACAWGIGMPNYDTAAYYRKVSRDWFDVQRDDGFINTIAPQIYQGAGGSLWSSAPVTLAWEYYKAFGDTRQLEATYAPMQRWLDFLNNSISEDGVLVPYDRVSRFLGDWATPHGSEYGDKPAAKLFNNCVYAYNLIIMVQAAEILGKTEDVEIYQDRLDRLRRNAHRHFYNEETRNYIDGRQLAMAFPLYVGITPESERDAVFAGFVDEITERKPYLDTGSSGLPILLKYLVEDAERADLLYRCLVRTEYPGYGHFIEEGATTWPEFWDLHNHDSHIHTCYTGISGYLTKAIGGIRPDPERYGMQQFLIKPMLVGDLTHANTTSGSLYGNIVSNWSRQGTVGAFEIEVPPNTTAKIFIPAESADSVKEGDTPAADSVGVTALGQQDGYQVFSVPSGHYRFQSSSVPATR